MLAGGQEGRAGKEIGVPERDFAGEEAVDKEAFPGVIFDDQVGEQGVLGHGRSHFFGRSRPGRPLEEIIDRQHRLAAQRDAAKQQKRQDQKSRHNHKIELKAT